MARDDREITDGYERQAVITAAGLRAGPAGLWADSDALLKANLAKSHSPYYLMSQLGSNARKLGRKTRRCAGTPRPSRRAKARPRGCSGARATCRRWWTWRRRTRRASRRLAAQLLAEQRVSTKLLAWARDGKQAAVMRRLQTQLAGVCAKVDTAEGQRAACDGLLKPAAKKAG
jgi:hypothetical protein